MISVELHVIGGKHSGQVIRLDRKKFLIGREADCQLRPNSELVSRHHCVFTCDDFSVRIRDLGSTNGTMVNGEQIRKEVVLQADDHVVVGSLEFKVAINEVSDVSQTGKISAVSEETVVAGADTLAEMPPVETPNAELASDESASPAETATPPEPAPAAEPVAEQPTEAAPAPEQPPAEPVAPAMPQQNVGDTTVISQPMLMPGQTPYQPMMQQPMGYPQMYGNYPYPQVPGQMPMYPQQPGFPGAMPGYPQQPPQPQQVQPAAPAPPAEASQPTKAGDTVSADGVSVALPDPSETGAKEAPPKPPTPPSEEGEKSDEVASNQTAADIIQQHMRRRPGGK